MDNMIRQTKCWANDMLYKSTEMSLHNYLAQLLQCFIVTAHSINFFGYWVIKRYLISGIIFFHFLKCKFYWNGYKMVAAEFSFCIKIICLYIFYRFDTLYQLSRIPSMASNFGFVQIIYKTIFFCLFCTLNG